MRRMIRQCVVVSSPVALTVLSLGVRTAAAGGFGIPGLDAFLTTFATGVTGMGILIGGVGLAGYIGSQMDNPFSTILAGSINFFTKSAEKPRHSCRGGIGVGRAGLNAQEPNKTHAVPEPSMGEGTAEREAPAFMPGRMSPGTPQPPGQRPGVRPCERLSTATGAAVCCSMSALAAAISRSFACKRPPIAYASSSLRLSAAPVAFRERLRQDGAFGVRSIYSSL